MDQFRTPLESTDLESLEASSAPDDTIAAETSALESAGDRSSGAMGLYARAMSRHRLLDPESERKLAVEIEERGRALWTALLSDPATAAPVARLTADRLPAARAVLRRVERAVPADPGRREAKARRLEDAARAAGARLHAVDVDHVIADEMTGLVAAAARDPALARAILRPGARTRASASYARAVADSARAVAEARTRFVQANIGLVFHVAGRYRSSSLSLADFVQEGMLGLIKAVDRFDHRRGFRFSTYATWWIRHAMGRALTDKSRLVRVPVHLQESRQRLDALGRTLRRELGREPTRQELADAAGLSQEKLALIQEVNAPCEIRLDAPIGEDEGRPRAEFFLHPAEPFADPYESLDREALARAVERHMLALSPIEQDVLRRRFALGGAARESTLQEIANDHGLSRERIRQIQVGALRKLRAQLEQVEEPGERAA